MFAEVTAPTSVTGLNAENQGNGMEKDAGSPECVLKLDFNLGYFLLCLTWFMRHGYSRTQDKLVIL